MGFPNIPNITPEINISREDALNLILLSIAFEELGLAHILNAEGEKLQRVIEIIQNQGYDENTINNLLMTNESISRLLRNVIKKEMLLQFKLEDATRDIRRRCVTEIRGPDGTLWFIVEFISLKNRTWTYKITNVDAPFGLSHWSLRIGCIQDLNIVAYTPEDAEIDTTENETCPATDPSCGPTGQNFGIKYEYQIGKGESVTYTFTLDKDVTLGVTCFLLKFGQLTRCGIICGPQC